jgi:integrase
MNGSRALSETEINRMMEIANPRDRLLILTGINFGTRISEALELKFSDVEGKTLRLKSKKKSNNQEYPIPQSYKDAVKAVRKHYRGLGIELSQYSPMFMSTHIRTGKAISIQNALEIMRLLAKKAGAEGKVSFHSFRKSFVTRIYERTGFNIAETQKYSRHKSLSNLEYYIHTTDSMDLVCDGLWGAHV